MSGEDEPGCDGAIHSPKLSLQELVLRGAHCEVVFRAHHNKVDTAIVKAIPGGEGRGGEGRGGEGRGGEGRGGEGRGGEGRGGEGRGGEGRGGEGRGREGRGGERRGGEENEVT